MTARKKNPRKNVFREAAAKLQNEVLVSDDSRRWQQPISCLFLINCQQADRAVGTFSKHLSEGR